MATEKELAEVRNMIESFYEFAGIRLPNNFTVNEGVAAVFGTMLYETRRCSSAFVWVPQPPGGRASISWLATQLVRGLFNSYRKQLSLSCAREVIRVWRTPLEEAMIGLLSSTWRLPLWV